VILSKGVLAGAAHPECSRAHLTLMEHDDRILGNGDFVTEIIREAEKNVRRYLRVSELRTSVENAIKKICRKEGVEEQEMRMGVRTRKYSMVRAKISYHLSHEFGVSQAEIARQLGVCTSAIAKAIQKIAQGGCGKRPPHPLAFILRLIWT
jgi:hypothetical protein